MKKQNKLLLKDVVVRANSTTLKVSKHGIFTFSVKVFDRSYRNGDSLNVSTISKRDKLRSALYDAFQLRRFFISKSVSEAVGVYGINAEMRYYTDNVGFTELRNIKPYLKNLATFTINWLAGEDLYDCDENTLDSDDCFVYFEAVNRTRKIGEVKGIKEAIKVARNKFDEVKFVKLDVDDFEADIHCVFNSFSEIRGYIAELIVYDMLVNYLERGQIDVIVAVYGLNAINAQKHVLKDFAKVLISSVKD